jgi:hypothetical protein
MAHSAAWLNSERRTTAKRIRARCWQDASIRAAREPKPLRVYREGIKVRII